jgi:hypothetical protein
MAVKRLSDISFGSCLRPVEHADLVPETLDTGERDSALGPDLNDNQLAAVDQTKDRAAGDIQHGAGFRDARAGA